MDFAGRGLTLLAVVVAWVFFRSHGAHQSFLVLHALVRPISLASAQNDVAEILHGSQSFELTVALVVLVVATFIIFLAPNTDEIFRLTERYTSRDRASTVRPPLWNFSLGWALSTGCLLTLAILYLSNPSEFLYFRF